MKRLFFPPKCTFCNTVLVFNAVKPLICKNCLSKVKTQEVVICDECGKPQDIKVKAPYCPYCAKENFRFQHLISPFTYNPTIREGIHHLKFDKRPTAAETFGLFIYERMLKTELADKIKLLVPAPLSEERLEERGYNQTELICRYISKVSGIPYRNALKKTQNTIPQSSLSYEERKKNIKGTIAPASAIPEDDILLIDDVYTTGSTCDECCKILKQMGVKRIYVAVSAANIPDDENEEQN